MLVGSYKNGVKGRVKRSGVAKAIKNSVSQFHGAKIYAHYLVSKLTEFVGVKPRERGRHVLFHICLSYLFYKEMRGKYSCIIWFHSKQSILVNNKLT